MCREASAGVSYLPLLLPLKPFRVFDCIGRQGCMLGVHGLILSAILGFCLMEKFLCLLLNAALGSVSFPADFHESRVGPCVLCGTSGQNAFSACSEEGLLPS